MRDEEIKAKLLDIKEKGDRLIEDLEIIAISLKVTKDRFSVVLKDSHKEAEEKITAILDEQVSSIIENHKKIRNILYERILFCYRNRKIEEDKT